VGNLEKSRECFSLEKHSPDAGRGGIERWPKRPVPSQFPAQEKAEHPMLSTGRGYDTVRASGDADVSSKFASVSNREHQMSRRASGGCVW